MRRGTISAARASCVIALLGVTILLASCGGGGHTDGSLAAAGVGPAGGTIAGTGTMSQFVVTVPPGAVASFTAITITPGDTITQARTFPVGPAFHIDAGGVTFAVPVTLTIPYDPDALYGTFPGADESLIHVGKREDTGETTWLTPTAIDTTNHTVTIEVTTFSTVQNVTTEPARYAYVSNYTSNTMSIYSVNNSNGRLRSRYYYYLGASMNPVPMSLDAPQTHVWITNFTGNETLGYTANADGSLTAYGTITPTGSGPVAFVIDPSTEHGFTANFNAGTLSTVDAFNVTTTTTIGATDYPEWIAMASNEFIFNGGNTANTYVMFVPCYGANLTGTNGELVAYRETASNGTLAVAQTITTGMGGGPIAAVVDPSSTYLYVAQWTSGVINAFSIAGNGTKTGELTALNTTTSSSSVSEPIALTTDVYGNYLVSANFASNNVTSFTIETTGTVGGLSSTPVGNAAVGQGPNAIQRDPAGEYVYEVSQGSNEIWGVALSQGNTGQPAAGTLTPGVPCRTQTNPAGIVVTSGATAVVYSTYYLYGATNGNGEVTPLAVSNTAGTITSATGAAVTETGVVSVAIEPHEKYLYVAESGGSVLSYSMSGGATGTGALTAGNTVALSAGLTSIATEPSGEFLFALNRSAKTITVLSINQTNGQLTSESTTTGVGTGNAQQLAVDPTGRFLYVADGGVSTTSPAFQESIDAYSINPSSGALTFIASYATGGTSEQVASMPSNIGPLTLAVDSTGRFLYIPNVVQGSVTEYSIDNTAGSLTKLGTLVDTTHLNEPICVAANPTQDVVYVVSAAGDTIATYSINTTTTSSAFGELTFVGSAATSTGPIWASVDLSGLFAYVCDYSASAISLYKVNQSNGSLTANSTASITLNKQPVQLAVQGLIQ
jgi:6-phosphogluconolactonase (cycloisomerase 2 family)